MGTIAVNVAVPLDPYALCFMRCPYTVRLCYALVRCLRAYCDGVRAKPRNMKPYLVHKDKHRAS